MKNNYYLVLTSSMFSLPILYALNYNLYLPAIISLGTCIFSINYWIKPNEDWRRKIDLFYAKITLIFYLIFAYINITTNYELYLLYIGVITTILLYISSYIFNNWLPYYITFHIAVVLMKLYVLTFAIK